MRIGTEVAHLEDGIFHRLLVGDGPVVILIGRRQVEIRHSEIIEDMAEIACLRRLTKDLS